MDFDASNAQPDVIVGPCLFHLQRAAGLEQANMHRVVWFGLAHACGMLVHACVCWL